MLVQGTRVEKEHIRATTRPLVPTTVIKTWTRVVDIDAEVCNDFDYLHEVGIEDRGGLWGVFDIGGYTTLAGG